MAEVGRRVVSGPAYWGRAVNGGWPGGQHSGEAGLKNVKLVGTSSKQICVKGYEHLPLKLEGRSTNQQAGVKREWILAQQDVGRGLEKNAQRYPVKSVRQHAVFLELANGRFRDNAPSLGGGQRGSMGKQEQELLSMFGWPWDTTTDYYCCFVMPSSLQSLTTAKVDKDSAQTPRDAAVNGTPYTNPSAAFKECTTIPCKYLRASPSTIALFPCVVHQISFNRVYSTNSSRGWNNGSHKAPLFRSHTAYYDILGVAGSATQSEIKTAYYRQSFLYHPDRNSGNRQSADRFSEITEAYHILGSVTLRKKYDRGILSLEDVRSAGKPSERKEGPAMAKRAQTTSSSHYSPSKPVFDFDEFYRAHYGEQLERERLMRWMREQQRLKRQKLNEKWQLSKLTDISAIMFLCAAIIIFFNVN
ncbi:dnaJ homolog subfamily C member 30, mitochondrial [Ambystoma mexicanum]|uniref:dnaJ homolog subfamily C member 30, mitochondrial n=1 Tax=Ambystoma mexicanum TaxID=8296 RepID=UPI0037E88B36